MELIASSPMQATIDSGATAADATITFSESGVVDLNRLQLLIQDDDAGQATGTGVVMLDITGIARVAAITLNGTQLLVAGRNTALPPAGAFARGRSRNFVQLGKYRVSSGDTLVVSASYLQTGTDGRFSIAAPFTPDRFRGMANAGTMDRDGEVWVGSPEVTITDVDGTATAITITFDKPGLIDLSRIVIKCNALLTCTIAADAYAASAINKVPLFLRQLILRSDYNIVVGQGTPIAPASFDWDRSHNWYDLGIHRVVPGDTLTATVALYDTGVLLDNASAGMGVPQLPDSGFGPSGGFCVPCAS
jgi:hypothetical protein